MSALDPLQRRLEREAEEEAKAQAAKPKLNPLFPFKAEPFDPWFFGLEQLPPERSQQSGKS